MRHLGFASSFVCLLCSSVAIAQVDSTHRRHQPWVEIMLGSRLPGGFFAISGGVELGRFLIPNAVFGLGGGPDGATIALGNEVRILAHRRLELRAFAYGSYAFGREEVDEFNSGYVKTTESSRSVKLGGSVILHTNLDVAFSIRAGYSFALDVPMVTEERPTGTTSHPADAGYFSNALLLGAGVMIPL